MKKILFNDGWQFTSIDTEKNRDIQREMSIWKEVELPHDWTTDYEFNISNPSAHQGGYVQMGVGWYRKYFVITEQMLESEHHILFDGVYHNSLVYLNGVEVGGREYGYSQFLCNISDYIKEGLNLLVVKVDCSKEPSSRWFNGAGITRNVWHLQGNQQYIPHNGVYIKCQHITEESVNVDIELKIVNKAGDEQADVEIIIVNKGGDIVESCHESVLLVNGDNKCHTELKMCNPQLWSCEKPNLYQCRIRVTTKESQDSVEEIFGVRSLEFRPNEGFFLNQKLG